MKSISLALVAICLGVLPARASAQEPTVAPAYDAALAKRLGADERGMHRYVLVILKTGPTRVPDGEARKAMFAGHFANMSALQGRKAGAGRAVRKRCGGVAWLVRVRRRRCRGSPRLVATDPVIVNGEMVAEYHPWYGSAATMMIPELHDRLVPGSP